MKINLGTRIFLLTALLISLAVGASVGVIQWLGSRNAHAAAESAVAQSSMAQNEIQVQRLDQLRLISRIFVSDPYFAAYLIQAQEDGDPVSILDILEERQVDLGFDFAIVLDPDGSVLARTDDPDATGEDLSSDPLVIAAFEADFEAYGVWRSRERLHHAVAVPLVSGGSIVEGILIAGFSIDEMTAFDLRRITNAEVAFLALDSTGPKVVGSTLDGEVSEQLVSALGPTGLLRTGRLIDEESSSATVTIADRSWLVSARALDDWQEDPLGAMVSLVSLDETMKPYQEFSRTVLMVGAVAVLLASILAWIFGRRLAFPIRRLTQSVSRASRGDYEQNLELKRGDEVGVLAKSVDVLLSELREKRDMESYVSQISRSMGDDDKEKPELAPAESRELSLLALDLRRFASGMNDDPQEKFAEFTWTLRRISRAAEGQKGVVESNLGHRVLVRFDGPQASYRALSTAAEILDALGSRSQDSDMGMPAVAIVSGRAFVGGILWSDRPSRAVLGTAVQQVDSLLREATPGDLLLSKKAHQELRDTFGAAGLELAPQESILSTQPIFLLNTDMALRLSGTVGADTDVMPATVASSRVTLSNVMPGKVLGGRFEILSTLGAGGMGVVYKVRDRKLDDLVALKMLKRDVWEDTAHLERLKSELKLARKITHPNVLRTFDFGELDGIPFISMEYVRGITLRYLLDQTDRLPFSAALRIVRQLCQGLAAAHGQEVIHRDIKPENLIIEASGNAKLMDFGIARPVKRTEPGQTQAGMIMGTPSYLSPEQLQGQEPDERADIYAVGVVLYELFTGRLPFVASTPIQVITKHLTEVPKAPSDLWPEIPPTLEKVILQCLEKEPEQRVRTVDSLIERLEIYRA